MSGDSGQAQGCACADAGMCFRGSDNEATKERREASKGDSVSREEAGLLFLGATTFEMEG